MLRHPMAHSAIAPPQPRGGDFFLPLSNFAAETTENAVLSIGFQQSIAEAANARSGAQQKAMIGRHGPSVKLLACIA